MLGALCAVLAVAVVILGLAVWRLARDMSRVLADTRRLAKAVTKVLVAREVPSQVDAIVWLRREFLWLDNRWPALAADVRKRPQMTAHAARSGALAEALNGLEAAGHVRLAPDEVAERVGLTLPATGIDCEGDERA